MIGFCSQRRHISGKAASAVPLVRAAQPNASDSLLWYLTKWKPHLCAARTNCHLTYLWIQTPSRLVSWKSTISADVHTANNCDLSWTHCNAQCFIIPWKEKVKRMSTRMQVHVRLSTGVCIYVHGWWHGCNKGKVCSGKEATRHLTWGEPLASCAAAAQLLLERSTVVAADGIRLIRY